MSSSYLGLLGLARRAGKLEIGDEAVKGACSKGLSKLLLLASDASERTKATFESIAESFELPCVTVSETREEIGNALGKRPSAVVAICDTGFSAAIAKKLADINENAKVALPSLEKRAKRSVSRKKTNRNK